LPQLGRLYCWYYWWEGFMMCTVAMDSGGMIYIPSSWRLVQACK
jgi:hypothetical protein